MPQINRVNNISQRGTRFYYFWNVKYIQSWITISICIESKIYQEPHIGRRNGELLKLMHSDLGYLKNTMNRWGKFYYVIFVDDYSKFTELYLLRTKDEADDEFIKYKNKVENQKTEN